MELIKANAKLEEELEELKENLKGWDFESIIYYKNNCATFKRKSLDLKKKSNYFLIEFSKNEYKFDIRIVKTRYEKHLLSHLGGNILVLQGENFIIFLSWEIKF